ncbi:MAG: threonylcarbamoyl-AMP synthase [Candidatus Cloacimonadota bacterium]|nr:MAG: threonylcarbamoyl-AMP synthase [Candidatus Cloacimonadota bacterium]
MNTKLIKFNKDYTSKEIRECADILLQNKVLIHPTENLYGFGSIISNQKGIDNIIKLKKRQKPHRFIILISNYSQLSRLAFVKSNLEYALMQKFWPGSLTIIFKANPNLNNKYSYNSTVAVRMVGNEITRKIIDYIDIPIISTSLNKSGEIPINSVYEIVRRFSGKVGGIAIDNIHHFQNIASTVVQIKKDKIYVLRRGAIDENELYKI